MKIFRMAARRYSKKSSTAERTVADAIIEEQMKQTIKKENAIKVILSNLADYLKHIDGIIINFNSITDNLRSFFDEDSVYFKPNLVFFDQIKAILMSFKDHYEDFRGFEGRLDHIIFGFDEMRNLKKEYEVKQEEFVHYKVKLEKLDVEKEELERKGKSCPKSKISKILRVRPS